ncbi:hypothetical protein H6B33_12090 [Gemmiger formicilis]|uniref:hypothetical protein n=1 Tax=Gemmiger formicilis TaxID=745368 RepID=UPI0019567F91|nr:hypothetical protein [Gemmiger formicilis]MBM6916134.1 hypothetical protein [Gemmiger formicilis]
MMSTKNAVPALVHRDGRGDGKIGRPTAPIVHQAAASCKTYLLRCGAILAALASVWWLCAIIEGTAGGVTGPLVLSGVCAWLAKMLADAAGRGYIDGED